MFGYIVENSAVVLLTFGVEARVISGSIQNVRMYLLLGGSSSQC